MWQREDSQGKSVLIVKKPGDHAATAKLKEIGTWCVGLYGLCLCLCLRLQPSLCSCRRRPADALCTPVVLVWRCLPTTHPTHARRLRKHGLRVLVEQPVAANEFPNEFEPFRTQLAGQVDLCVTLGGAAAACLGMAGQLTWRCAPAWLAHAPRPRLLRPRP